jgi:hypothetical protein
MKSEKGHLSKRLPTVQFNKKNQALSLWYPTNLLLSCVKGILNLHVLRENNSLRDSQANLEINFLKKGK